MSFTRTFTVPFYEGAGVSTLVPGVWDVAVNGRPYMIDTRDLYTGDSRHARQSISLLKPQQDTTAVVGQHSLNPDDGPRRDQETWHHGAGQTYFDRDGPGSPSDEARFRSSKGVDPWTKWELSPLNGTSLARSSSNSNMRALPVGGYLYACDGNEVYWTLDPYASTVDWNPVSIQAGETPGLVRDMCTDGYTVFVALGANGVHATSRGSVSATHMSDLQATFVAHVKGRLMAAETNSIYNITSGPAAPSPLMTHPSPDFRWVAAANGPGFIYLAGFMGDKTSIYKVTVVEESGTLGAPVIAGELPDGQIVRGMTGYLGYLLVGTDNGWQIVDLDGSGNVSGAGKIIPTGAAVLALEPQDRFVWYGWANYDSASSGLGRSDLGVFPVDPLTPAYASDLMADATGNVTSVATFANKRLFTVDGAGLFVESATPVPQGTLDSGLVTYGLPDPKIAVTLDVRFASLTGTVSVALASDGGAFDTVGTATSGTRLVASAGQVRGDTFEIRLTLSPAGSSVPTVTRWTLEANPAPGRGQVFQVPLLLHEWVETEAGGNKVHVDIAAEVRALLNMEALGKPITFQDGEGTTTVFLDDHVRILEHYTKDRKAFNGVFIAQFRQPRQRS